MTELSCNRIENNHNLCQVTAEHRHVLFAIFSRAAAPAINIGNILYNNAICNTNTFDKPIFDLDSKLVDLLELLLGGSVSLSLQLGS